MQARGRHQVHNALAAASVAGGTHVQLVVAHQAALDDVLPEPRFGEVAALLVAAREEDDAVDGARQRAHDVDHVGVRLVLVDGGRVVG